MKDALAIHRALLELETVHEIVRLPVALAHADELPKALGLPADRCLVTRVYACDGRERPFLTGVIVPAGVRPSLDAVGRAVGADVVRPARADVVNAVTEYAAGLVCPLLLPDDMPLLIDQRFVDGHPADKVVYTATGEASTALGIRGRTLYGLCRATPSVLFHEPSSSPATRSEPRRTVA
ncbi:prolyl-tRNA editing enzyme YbaK/EbsC (Cys-tRNA(Pro) deacylase) [Actinomadura pelletieri DSM 43383]|uniref:Prolyl-tRNA editing enzyme YbaK/EbsC (Cys-tRNA(Pro) deacylase) n=1 Tax=Actinomadura pelletieri DSM 43383 TaxID=1120940 RepID=A0A495QYL8_9ACTN|nr:YbaK/EbsC family protein [Actinomadura pelletieri]RKS79309.1 prolyl-tRNA editing enzyme YbaK/EbsC (Cys-tRNA(Pro) deacylase) [Actinomadura pelletieri DSM 43383]